MPKQKKTKTHPGRGGLRVSLAPLTPDQALRAVLQIKKEDVQKIIGKGAHQK